MPKVELQTPFKTVRGKAEKDSNLILRRKGFRAPNGKVLKQGPQESYTIKNPRDYTVNPPKGAELDNINSFAESKRVSSVIINSEKVTEDELATMTPEERQLNAELRTQLESYRKRFYAQFKKPDPEAPFEKNLQPGASKLRRKQYSKLDTFIQAIIRTKL